MIYRIAFLLGLLFAGPAFAADNATLVTPCASGCVTMRSKDIGAGVQSMIQILGDATGAAIYGTAGTANANVLTIQGIASMTKLLVTPDSVALPANQSVNAAQINGVTPLMGNGATGTGSPRVTIASDNTAFAVNAASTLAAETTKVIGTVRNVGNVGGVLDAIGQNVAAPANWLQTGCQFQTSPTTITATNGSPLQCNNAAQLLVSVANANANGQATAANSSPVVAPVLTVAGAAVVKGGVPVVNGGSTYQAVAASQTATVLQTSTGAIGDYLSHCDIYPTSTSPGVVTVFDNTNAAAGSAILFPGGATSLSNLAPISVPVGAVSTAGAWKVTTGASVSVVCYGKFS